MAKLSNEQWAEVAEKYKSGVPSTTLAEQYGVHYTTVLNNMRRLGQKVRTYQSDGGPVLTPAVKAELDRLAKAGMNGRDIARTLGISYSLVYRRHKFTRQKKEKPIKLTNKDKRVLEGLLDTLRKFRATERGLAQRTTIDPQIKVLRGLLS